MEFDELLVTTKVDALVRLVKEKGSIELNIAARLLGVEPENVEEWAHTLEEAGIVKIDYHLTKSYLSWIVPSEEEVAKESERLQKDKSDLSQEISLLQQQMAPKAKELEGITADFRELYNQLAPKIEKLQQQLSVFSASGTGPAKELGASAGKMDTMEKEISDLGSALSDMKAELSTTRSLLKENTPVESSFKRVEGVKKELSELGDRLQSVDERIELLQKSMPKEKMDRDSVQRSLDPLKKDFAEFKRSNANMRENLLSIREAFEVLGTLDKSVAERSEHIVSLKDELQRLLASLKDVQAQGNRLSEEVKHELGAISGYSESMEFVKTAFERFPSQKDVMKKMSDLEAQEKALEAKVAAVERSTSAATLPKISVEELLQLKEELNERRKQLAKEVQNLFDSVEKESATYSTFQKIKEKASDSLDSYDKTIGRMSGQLDAINKELARSRKAIDDEMEKMKGAVDDKTLAEMLKNAREVEDKKAVLDDVAESLDALSTASEGITKRLNLLARQTELLSIRASGDGGAGGGERVSIPVGYKGTRAETVQPPASRSVARAESGGQNLSNENEVRQQLSLTKTEQAEFDRKREELRQLIKKLWEQDN